MNTFLAPLVGFISIILGISLGIATDNFEVSRVNAAGGPTVYAVFDSADAKGIVEVSQFGSGAGSNVTARIQRPSSGIVGFCLTRSDGSKACTTVNPTDSSFDKSSKGCVSFTITFNPSEMPTRVELFDANFVVSYAAADLTTESPPNVGMLNTCTCR